MDEIKKILTNQDAMYKLTPCTSKETSFNISKEIALFLNAENEDDISFRIYKEDCLLALCVLAAKCPLYSRFNQNEPMGFSYEWYSSQYNIILDYFGIEDYKNYKVQYVNRNNERFYLQNLDNGSFNLRNLTLSGHSTLVFQKDESNNFTLRLDSQFTEASIFEDKVVKLFAQKVIQFLYDFDQFAAVSSLIQKNQGFTDKNDLYLISDPDNDISLTGLFIECTEEELQKRNQSNKRWFEKPFDLNGKNCYLSDQWYAPMYKNDHKTKFGLSIASLSKLIDLYYPNFKIKIREDDGVHIFTLNSSYESYKRVATPSTCNTLDAKTTYSVPQTKFNINGLKDTILSTGLIYSDEIIKRFAYSLMAKPFVILSGLAGSGKTQLAIAFAKCLSENPKYQVRVVSVGADWTNREPLLGYANALKDDEYVKPESKVLDLLLDAKDNPTRPYFLILDEMNLSVVERYFADFLSVMESKENISLWDGNENSEVAPEKIVPSEIALPKNVFIIGTINVDETTYMFSPKVLDRANVIEFKISNEEMSTFLSEVRDIHMENCISKCADMAEDFVTLAEEKSEADIDNEITQTLQKFFDKLKTINAEFGYRAVSEINRYIRFASEELGKQKAIDTAILQKLLPKLHGSRKKLSPVLSALWTLCFKEDTAPQSIEYIKDFAEVQESENLLYGNSAEKILRMYHAVIDNGFTSYAEA